MNEVTPALQAGMRLPLARYRLVFRMQEALRLPAFSGSLLRGQFGAALRRAACITRAKTCAGCPLLTTCPYSTIFETPPPAEHRLQKFSAVPNPYVIEPPPLGARTVPAGETLAFQVVLVGRALERLPLIVYAFQRAFERGLGRQRARAALHDVLVEQAAGAFVSIWEPDPQRLRPHDASLVVPALVAASAVQLRIETPLRLQDNGRALPPARLNARTLVMALLRRTELLFELHAGITGLGAQAPALARLAQDVQETRELHWFDWSRYSSRQQQPMTLGGVLGTWTLRGDLAPLLPWLWLGQWLHAGKNATMGMGAYRLVLS